MLPEEWDAVKKRVGECSKCSIRKTCKQTVFGSGKETPGGLMVIGEAPGETEDQTGQPFTGKSGKELERALKAIGYTRDDIFITNIVKCRPPNNRTPVLSEVQNCSGFLLQQLKHLAPRVIVALGAEASAMLLSPSGRKIAIGTVRGKLHHTWAGRVVPTWHPAYYLRSRSPAVWGEIVRDLKKARRIAEGKDE